MFNKVILVGRLTKDPILKTTNSGHAVCNYTLAVNRNYKNSDGQKQTDFLNIVCWRKLAEISSKYLQKGKLILVEGSIQSRNYQAQDGSNRTIVEIQAEQMQMLGSKNNSQQKEENYSQDVNLDEYGF